jgi:N-glycosylase/DNA lyase
VRLSQSDGGLIAETAEPVSDWKWITHYLQSEVELQPILNTFPDDPSMHKSIAACCGLRLLRQDPWECLASFILSSTKQIVQIQQIVGLLCERFGSPVHALNAAGRAYTFPKPADIMAAGETELRACKMGFRAPNLFATARMLVEQQLDLEKLPSQTVAEARAELMRCPGVGPKIANCVLLFGYGFPTAFPVDVWIMKGLRELYFPRRQPRPERLQRFVNTYFGEYSGYAQQYLFHYLRTAARHAKPAPSALG